MKKHGMFMTAFTPEQSTRQLIHIRTIIIMKVNCLGMNKSHKAGWYLELN